MKGIFLIIALSLVGCSYSPKKDLEDFRDLDHIVELLSQDKDSSTIFTRFCNFDFPPKYNKIELYFRDNGRVFYQNRTIKALGKYKEFDMDLLPLHISNSLYKIEKCYNAEYWKSISNSEKRSKSQKKIKEIGHDSVVYLIGIL